MNAPVQAAPAAASRVKGAAVEIRGVQRVYGSGAGAVTALQGVDLDIAPGAFLSILGPSGCGKSTLLNILAGFDHATSGTVLVDGRPVSGPSAQRGVVFQETAALFPWMSVASNVAFGPRSAGMPRATIRARVENALDLVGLTAFARKYPGQLSGGMRQLVAIARALIMEPRLLLMDEPFASLDALTRQRMQVRVVDIWRRTGVTVMFITHSVDEAIFLADEVVVMSGRPGSVRARLTVDIERPRDITSPRFNALKAEALNHLGNFDELGEPA